MNEILELPIGLVLGLVNDRNNQYVSKEEKKQEAIQGNAKMLMGL